MAIVGTLPQVCANSSLGHIVAVPDENNINTCLCFLLGNRSSADDSRDYSTEDETVIDPEQGNGTPVFTRLEI
jgi:hypothetical protein